MRLVRARVRSYRVLGDVEVSFDRERTVIGGANESGKSTFMEAVHRCLFLRAKAGGVAREEMLSRRHDGHPTVEVAFEVGGVDYVVSKEFRGASGGVRLEQGGGATLRDDEAEERLAALLGVEVAEGGRRGANQSMAQWAHLFVRQGQGWDDPTERATEQRDALVARLEAGGGEAAMVSARDSAVAERFAVREREWFTTRGEPKAGTELERAARAVERARERLGRAREAWERLGQAAGRLERAEETLRVKADEIRSHEAEGERVRSALGRVGELRGRERDQAGEVQRLEEEEGKLRAMDGQIAGLRGEREALDERLGQLREAVERGERERAAAAEGLEALRGQLVAAEGQVQLARRRHERARALAERHEVVEMAGRLRARVAEVARLRADAAGVRAERARLPGVGEGELEALRRAAAEQAAAAAALGAMVAGVELVAGGGQEVRVGGVALGEGESVDIDDVVEVEVGGARLLVRPGGGEGLAGARERERRARQVLGEQLAALGLGGLDEAAAAAERRARLGGQLDKIDAQLAGLGGDEVEDELGRVEGRLAALDGLLERGGRVGVEDEDESKGGEGGWRAREAERELALRGAEQELGRLEGKRAEAAEVEKGLRAELAGRGRELTEVEREAHGLRVRIETLEGEAGDGAARLERLGELAAGRSAAAARLEGTRRELAALDPEGLEADVARLGRALAEAREQRERAGREAAVERAVLVRDGSADPAAELEAAEAELEAAEAVERRAARRGRAVQLLARLFREEQGQLAERFTRPLAERAAGYLGRVFGGDLEVKMRFEDGGFGGLELVRAGGAHPFGELSGGAREQVAAAFRLGMAEVLAEEHGGCLPVVFDDAFVNADPERVRGLLRMLDLAACRGLQVVVLTCDPGRYGGLGAREVAFG